MKKMIIYSFLMACSMMFASCQSDKYSYYEGGTAPNANITVSTPAINVPSDGGECTVTIGTTGKEWDAYSNEKFITVVAQNTIGQSGTVTVTVPANLEASARTGSVIIMSGSARSSITISQAASAEPPYNVPEGYSLVWQDEFDNGPSLNADFWTHEVKGAGWVNNELQNYVNQITPDGAKVTELKNGKLRITCLKENGKIYSGRVYAKQNEGWTYGYIEARIKLPKGKGTWPAFWMMPVNFKSWPADGEIDIMEEVGGHANYVSSSLHANSHVHTHGTQVTHEMYLEGAEDDFHIYSILWTAKNITTYVDGQVQLSYDNTGKGRDDWPYEDPFYIIFNLAWGGDWGAAYGIDESALPCTMEIDYVRVYQKK